MTGRPAIAQDPGRPPASPVAIAGPVLLIACYELGHQPAALLAPAEALRHAGIPVALLDLSVGALDPDRVRSAAVIALSVPMLTALRTALDVLPEIRRLNPSAPILLWGLYAGLNRDYLSSLGCTPLERDPTPALLDLYGGSSVLDRSVAPGESGLPFESVRLLLPGLASYARLLTNDGECLVASVSTTEGCKHRCLHCPITPIYHGRFRAVPRDLVLSDIRGCVALGADHIDFADPDFLNGPTHALTIARQLHTEFPDLTWNATIKIEHLLRHRALLPELAALGCAFILSAAESIDDMVLQRLDKGHTAADIDVALGITAAADIPLRLSLVAFTPWNGLDEYLRLLDFVAQRGLQYRIDPVQFSIRLLIPPRSALLPSIENEPWLGPLIPEELGYRWTHPDSRVDHLQRELATLVDAATSADEDPATTFERIRQAAHAAAARPLPPAGPPPLAAGPHLSEAWFCCAEPLGKLLHTIV